MFCSIILQVCLGYKNLNAQKYQANKIIPPSPTAAALGSYGNTPVSYYNGTPSISIPLYAINTVNHQVKINMSYDASGTRVAQDAPWVGLGWSLNGGGVVSRIIRQKDDFSSSGYYYAQALPTGPTIITQADMDYCWGIIDGSKDSEPDIYSYNFNGYSGRFVLGKFANGSPVFLDEKNNLDIAYVNGGWRFTTGEGYKYYFSTIETSQDYVRSAGFDMPPFTGIDGLSMSLDISPVTAWHLDSIVAPTGEAVRYSYVKGKGLSVVNRSEILNVFNKIIEYSCSSGNIPSPDITPAYHSYDVSRQVLSDVYLQKISFTGGTIEFNTSLRNDIEYLSGTDNLLLPSKLDNIIVKNSTGAQIKKYQFYYTYFNSADINGRLKLDSIAEVGAGTLKIPPYSFTYINPNSLPYKTSKSIDHWGFYNGIVNSTLLPTTSLPDRSESFYGADRSADTVNNYPMNGMLSVIKYPTGGSTTFEYELNDYSNLRGDLRYIYVNRFAMVRANPDINPNGHEESANFTILPDPQPFHENDKIPVTITCSYQKVNPNVSDLPSFGYSNMWQILGNGQQQSVADCNTANYDQPNPGPTDYKKNLSAGNYRMLVQSTSGWSFAMTASWKEKQVIVDDRRIGGGVRIKKITDLDANGNENVRTYSYKGNDGKSSGLLLGEPKYAVTYISMKQTYTQPPTTTGTIPGTFCELIASYTQIISGSLYPSGLNSKSGIVGYSKITEINGRNGENGKTEFYFRNTEETVDDFPGVPTTANALNGKPSATIVYNATGDILKKTTYDYQLKEQNSIPALKIFTNNALQGDGPPSYYYRFYNYNSSWSVTSSEKEDSYSNGNNLSVTKNNYYDNTSHREMTRMEVAKSDGSLLVQKYFRAGDYTGADNNSFAAKLLAQHITSPVIEQHNLLQRNGVLNTVSANFTSYKNYNGFYKPDIEYKTEVNGGASIGAVSPATFQTGGQVALDANYKPQVYFDAYDDLGNIRAVRKASDIGEVYLWGYQSQYPVAKISGTDYNTVKQYVDQNLLNAPATDQQLRDHLALLRTKLPGTIMTYYTYDPLRGMTSATDENGITTYYEYDAMGRLANIKDKNGKILKQYDYQYQRPVSQ